MLFQYIGDGKQAPEQINFMGHKFTLKGDAVEVTDAKVIAKIEGIKTFVKVEGKKAKTAEPETPTEDPADYQGMRKALKDAGVTVPRKNEDVVAAFVALNA